MPHLGYWFFRKCRILENNAVSSRNFTRKFSDVSSRMNVFGLCSFSMLSVTVRYMKICKIVDPSWIEFPAHFFFRTTFLTTDWPYLSVFYSLFSFSAFLASLQHLLGWMAALISSDIGTTKSVFGIFSYRITISIFWEFVLSEALPVYSLDYVLGRDSIVDMDE